jgi:hypothetical protein
MSKDEVNWQTLWLIVGPRLPANEIHVSEGIYLARLGDASYERFKLNDDPNPRFSGNTDGYVVHYPPRDHVFSRYRLQIDVRGGEDMDEAIARADEIANRLLTSLSLIIPGGRYHAGLRRIRRTDQAQEHFAWSQSAMVTLHTEPDPFEQNDLIQVLELFEKTKSDPIAENAYIHLQTAWQLQSTAGSKPLQRSILQHYVLSMETIVAGLAAKIRQGEADKVRLAEREFAKAFAEELPRRSDKPKAIREASTKLRDLTGANMLASIDLVGSKLQLDEQIVEEAKRLYQFRSRTLSHPGRGRADEFAKWLKFGPEVHKHCVADILARSFLASYCGRSQ